MGSDRNGVMPAFAPAPAIALALAIASASASALAVSLPAGPAWAQEPLERGSVATLDEVGAHQVWIVDVLFAHSGLFDGDSGEMLAQIDSGTTLSPKPPLYSPTRGEFYAVEIDYARGRRGLRTDYVTIYDAHTVDVIGEVVLPTRTSESATSVAHVALLDDAHFLATFNQFPNTGVSITDLAARRFVGEVSTAGCAGIYPAGPRRFGMLCGNGVILDVELSKTGQLAGTGSSAVFFDVVEDAVMMSGARHGSRWLFPSFAGRIHEVDFAASPPTIESWSLLSDADREEGWRPGGKQPLALHRGTRRMYAIMHQGGAGTHKDPGPEIWVYDLAARERIARYEAPNFMAAFLGKQMGVEGGFTGWLLRSVLPGGGAHSIAVTQDDAPLLFARNQDLGVVAVLDGRSGEHLRDLHEVGLTGNRMVVPR